MSNNELEESISIKNLKMAKLYFCSFSGLTSTELDHYIIPSLVADKPDAVIIHVGTKTFYTMSAMNTSLGTSSRLVQIVKIMLLTMPLFRPF